jgi:hypothetical protein
VRVQVGGIERARKTFHRLPRNGGWFNLLAAQEINVELDRLIELGCDLEFAIDRNYDDGINSRVNCLRVFAGRRVVIKPTEAQVRDRHWVPHLRRTAMLNSLAVM